MKNLTLLIAGLLMALHLSSCSKKTQVPYTLYNNPVLTNLNFQPGSYWIFRDSATGQEDSLVVYQQRIDTVLLNDIRQYAQQLALYMHNYEDTAVLQASLYIDNNYINLYDGIGTHVLVEVRSQKIIDTSILGTPYSAVRKFTDGYRQYLFKDGVGPIQYSTYLYNTGYTARSLRQLVRYHVII